MRKTSSRHACLRWMRQAPSSYRPRWHQRPLTWRRHRCRPPMRAPMTAPSACQNAQRKRTSKTSLPRSGPPTRTPPPRRKGARPGRTRCTQCVHCGYSSKKTSRNKTAWIRRGRRGARVAKSLGRRRAIFAVRMCLRWCHPGTRHAPACHPGMQILPMRNRQASRARRRCPGARRSPATPTWTISSMRSIARTTSPSNRPWTGLPIALSPMSCWRRGISTWRPRPWRRRRNRSRRCRRSDWTPRPRSRPAAAR